MIRAAAILAAVVVGGGSAVGQGMPPDPRIVEYVAVQSGLIHLATSSDTTQTLLTPPGEKILSVILSDPQNFSVAVSGVGDSLTVRAKRMNGAAIMTVRTDLRVYEFQLAAQRAGFVPSVVRLVERPTFTQAMDRRESPGPPEEHTYRLSGNEALKPTSISDDGERTYIEWAGDRSLPATFATGPSGGEQMVEGYMRAGKFTIDRVYSELTFRIDREAAKARRILKRGKDGR